MGQIIVEKNIDGIEGLCVITPAIHGDSRGYFMETYNQKDMEDAGAIAIANTMEELVTLINT